jgi:hypothetical protein
MAALARVLAALAGLAVGSSAVVLVAPSPAAAAVTSMAAQDAVLVPGTHLNSQAATLNAASVDGEQFDVAMPPAIGGHVLAVVDSRGDPCTVTVAGQQWHCQPYPGVTRLSVQYQTDSMRASDYPMVEHTFPVTFTDSTTGAQATAHVTVQPSTDLSTYVGATYPSYPSGAGIDVEVMNHGPSESSSASVVITVTGTYVTTSMPAGCARAGQQVTCSIPELLVGADTRRLIPLASGTAEITLAATVTAGAGAHDPDSGNSSYSTGPWIIFPPGTGGNGNTIPPPPPGTPAVHGPGSTAGAPTPVAIASVVPSPAASGTGPAGSPTPGQSPIGAGGRSGGPDTAVQLASGPTHPGSTAWLAAAVALPVLALLAGGFLTIRRRRVTGVGEAMTSEAAEAPATPAAG